MPPLISSHCPVQPTKPASPHRHNTLTSCCCRNHPDKLSHRHAQHRHLPQGALHPPGLQLSGDLHHHPSKLLRGQRLLESLQRQALWGLGLCQGPAHERVDVLITEGAACQLPQHDLHVIKRHQACTSAHNSSKSSSSTTHMWTQHTQSLRASDAALWTLRTALLQSRGSLVHPTYWYNPST